MTSLRATKFYKQLTCPASETLLSYRALDLAHDQRKWVAKHLTACEFCGAEFQLLSEHPPYDECEMPAQTAAMPKSLRYLAEAILAGNTPQAAANLFAGILLERSPLTLTDA
ncbi:MAG: hypothetical protein ABR577_11845 [Pyrinomonadaceae bacterium]